MKVKDIRLALPTMTDGQVTMLAIELGVDTAVVLGDDKTALLNGVGQILATKGEEEEIKFVLSSDSGETDEDPASKIAELEEQLHIKQTQLQQALDREDEERKAKEAIKAEVTSLREQAVESTNIIISLREQGQAASARAVAAEGNVEKQKQAMLGSEAQVTKLRADLQDEIKAKANTLKDLTEARGGRAKAEGSRDTWRLFGIIALVAAVLCAGGMTYFYREYSAIAADIAPLLKGGAKKTEVPAETKVEEGKVTTGEEEGQKQEGQKEETGKKPARRRLADRIKR